MSNTSTFTISKKAKKEWLKRLRSGNYEQTKSELYNVGSNAYCCLGVLCEVEGVETAKLAGKKFPHDVGVATAMTETELRDFLGEATYNEVMGDYLVEPYDFTYAIKTKYYGWVPLSYLNDSEGLTFDEIADLIEKYVETH